MAVRRLRSRNPNLTVVAIVLVLVAAALTAAACAPSAAPSVSTSAPKAGEPAKPAAQPIVLRASTDLKEISQVVQVDRIAEIVKERTKGELTIVNMYNALGTEQQSAQMVMDGTVDLGTMANGNASRWTNSLYIWDLPFLFKDYKASLEAWDSPLARKGIDQFEKDLKVKFLLACSLGGGREIQTRDKQLKVPADIKGLKMRVVSTPIDLATFRAWGANPTPIDWGQTYAALQQGVVEGMAVALNNLLANKHYEVTNYTVRVGYQPIVEVLMMNPSKFASLSPQHQKVLLDAINEVKPWGWKQEEDKLQETERKLTELGPHRLHADVRGVRPVGIHPREAVGRHQGGDEGQSGLGLGEPTLRCAEVVAHPPKWQREVVGCAHPYARSRLPPRGL